MGVEKSLVIIGAGVAGLAAGVYALRSGYKVVIVERHTAPGGLCTSWHRAGYLFDGSAAGLAGTSPDAPIRRLWEELGVIGHCDLFDPDNFGSIRLPDGRIATVWTDIARFESHFIELFPTDADRVREFSRALRACAGVDIPFSGGIAGKGNTRAAAAWKSALLSLPAIVHYSRVTLRKFLDTLKDPACRLAFENLVHFGGFDIPLLSVILPLAYAHRKATGIPRRGWLDFARAIEARYLSLGGDLRYGIPVVGLIASSRDSKGRPQGRVLGVKLGDGSEILADRVISAADGRFTSKVLKVDDESKLARDFKLEDLSDQPVQVNLGVAEDWSAIRGPLTLILEGGQEAAGCIQTKLTVHNKYYDPSAAPDAKSALMVFLESSYGFWAALKDDSATYAEEKAKCAELVIRALERERPGIRGRVEVVDVSTPLTRERFTGNWMGPMQARKPGKSMFAALLAGGPRYADSRLSGFYRAGQWVEAWGGITTAAQSGRNAVKAMCKRDTIRFDDRAGS
jgi:phytoene dehydrogenase-like protein